MSASERKATKRPASSRATWYAASASDHVPITEEIANEVAQALRPLIKAKGGKRSSKIMTVDVRKANTKDLAQTDAARVKAGGEAVGVKGDFDFVTIKVK